MIALLVMLIAAWVLVRVIDPDRPADVIAIWAFALGCIVAATGSILRALQ